jgi:hypothetical protein
MFDVQSFADQYCGPIDAFSIADALRAHEGRLGRVAFYNLVCACEDALHAKTGYVSPFAHLADAPNAWEPK